jgi:hypothetical protein
MFVIPTKYSTKSNFILQLCEDIRKYHPDEKIVIVDSDSKDKSYFKDVLKYDVILEDIKNKNWSIGAFWHVFKKFPNEDFYYFINDSMRVKSNLDIYKKNPLTILCYFDRNFAYHNGWGRKISRKYRKPYVYEGLGVYGPIFFCKNEVMRKLLQNGVDKFMPKNKKQLWYCEGAYGFFLEDLGFELKKCALFGDVIENESATGKSGHAPHNTSWQFPVEKFYGNIIDSDRKK